MARHIMAVCVVCLLCAHRLHCQDHVESLLGPALVMVHSEELPLNARVYTNPSPSSETTDRRQQRSVAGDDDTPNYSTSPPSRRQKRHAGHGDSDSGSRLPQITQYYLEKLMVQNKQMDSSGFEGLLQQLRLQSLVSGSGAEGTVSLLAQI